MIVQPNQHTCSGVMPVKQNIPIWLVICSQFLTLPAFARPLLSFVCNRDKNDENMISNYPILFLELCLMMTVSTNPHAVDTQASILPRKVLTLSSVHHAFELTRMALTLSAMPLY